MTGRFIVVGMKEGFSRRTVRLNGELLVQGPKLAEMVTVVVTKSGFAASVAGNELAAAFKAALKVNVADSPFLSFSRDGDTVTPEGNPVTVMDVPSPKSPGEDACTVIACEEPGVNVIELAEDARVT